MSKSQNTESQKIDKIFDCSNYKFGVVVSEWHSDITFKMKKEALNILKLANCQSKNIHSIKVPGSFELIFGCHKVQSSKKYDAILAIGSVIRGETSHFKYISQSVFDGIKDLNTNGNSPIILCLLTDDNYQQSMDRSGGKHGNKGYDCAAATAKISLI